MLAGETPALAEIHRLYEARGVRARILPVDYATHTVQVDGIADELHGVLDEIVPAAPRVPWYSTVDNEWITGPVDDGYWLRNLRQPVRFAEAIKALGEQGFGVFIESSSHPVLTVAVQDTLDDESVVVAGTLRRDQGDRARFVRSVAEVFVRGVDGVSQGQRVVLGRCRRSRHRRPTPPGHRRRVPIKPSENGGVGVTGGSDSNKP